MFIFFSSFLISFKHFSRNFNKDVLRLVSTFVASVAFVAFVTGSFAIFGSVAGSGTGSRVGILSKFFIGNNLLLKLVRTFSLALNNNPKLFKKDFLPSAFVPFSEFFNLIAKLLCL